MAVLRIPVPRLLPITIAMLALVLTLKSVALVRAAGAAAEPAAAPASQTQTGGAQASDAKPVDAKPVDAKPVDAKAADAKSSAVNPAASQPGAAGAVPKQDVAAVNPPAEQEPAATATPLPSGGVPVSDSEKALLLDLRHRRQELDQQSAAVQAREAALAAAEKRITARLDELANLQRKLETLDASRKQREEANWRGLVKTYESMRPRDAATIFNDLEMDVLLPVMDRMKEARAAAILAAMQPDKARALTAKLAETRLHQSNAGG